MKSIDFLPPEFLRRNEVRSLRWWWIGVCVAFGLFIATAATLQTLRRYDVRKQIAKLEPLCAIAKAQENRIAELGVALQEETEVANLYAFLEHPWPRSRILSDLIAPLPAEVQITSLKISAQLSDAPSQIVAETVVLSGTEPQEEMAPAIADLQKLWQRSSRTRTIIEIQGATRDPLRLYEYVGTLAEHSLFESAKVEAFEEVFHNGKRRMQFTVLIVVRPAYSLPGGPREQDSLQQSVAVKGVGE